MSRLLAPPSSFPVCGTGTGKAALTRADKKRLKAQREADIAAAERGRLAGPGAGGPESASEYDQQLLAAPNDSYLWIKYMAFQLKLGEGGWGMEVGCGMGCGMGLGVFEGVLGTMNRG